MRRMNVARLRRSMCRKIADRLILDSNREAPPRPKADGRPNTEQRPPVEFKVWLALGAEL